MKLYTEEQVIRIAKLYRHELYVLYAAIKTETPIELPSAKEIQEYINFTPYYGDCTPAYRLGIKDGAKWLKNLIQGGNK